MPTFKQFRERHESTGYFDDWADWAIDDSIEMRDAWQSLPFLEMRNLATFGGVLTDNELRRLSVFAARQVQHKLQDDASRNAIDVAEKFAEGQATLGELAAAHDASKSEPWFRGGNANAIRSAHAASDPKSGLVWSASEAISAASSALNEKDDRLAFKTRIVEWLRQNTNPQFDRDSLAPASI